MTENRRCFICGKEFEGEIKIEEAFENFKEKYGYMPNEDEYAEICPECSDENE